jgi:hypothetical protein
LQFDQNLTARLPRQSHIQQNHIDPGRILAITFTEKPLSTDPVTGRPCRVYECRVNPLQVNLESRFEVSVTKA